MEGLVILAAAQTCMGLLRALLLARPLEMCLALDGCSEPGGQRLCLIPSYSLPLFLLSAGTVVLAAGLYPAADGV